MKKSASAALSVLFAGTIGLAVGVEKASAAPHPRIHEVHHRMKDISMRVHEGVKSGKMTKEQAQAVHQQLKQIQEEMEADYKTNGKRELTPEQDQQLNQELDNISKTVYDEKHPDAGAPAGGTDAGTAAPPAGGAVSQ